MILGEVIRRAAEFGRRLWTRSMWDGAASGSRTANWYAPTPYPNRRDQNPAALHGRAADLYRNNPYARRAVHAIVNSAIGANGINPQFANRTLQAAWEHWARDTWAAIASQVLQAVIVSGECFVLLRIDPELPGVPLRLQVLGPEHIDESRMGADTQAGIRYDATGDPIGYWLFPRNPRLNLLGTAALQSVFVPASECLHLFRASDPGATRGQSWLNAALQAIREIDAYLEASLIRAKVGALYSGFVRTPDGSNPMAGNGTPTLEPASMVRLNPGEEVEFTEPPDVGASLDPFVRAQLRRIAAALDVPYEVLSGDSSQITFASGRHALLEWKRQIEAIQHNLMVPQFCEPVMRRWEAIAAALGEIEATGNAARWIAPAIEMLDPRADVLANVARVRAGFVSRSEIVAASGWRAEDIDAEIAADNGRADRLGLTLDSDGRRMTAQGQAQIEPQGQPV